MSLKSPEGWPEFVPYHPEAEYRQHPSVRDATLEELEEMISEMDSDFEVESGMSDLVILEGGVEGQKILDNEIEELRKAAHHDVLRAIIDKQYDGSHVAFLVDTFDVLNIDSEMSLSDTRAWKSELGVR